MKNVELKINLQFCQIDELSQTERMLIEKAIKATENSYAPYSNFNVGAAVLLGDGTVVMGANQENAAFPSGLCAERTALFAAQAQYPEQEVPCWPSLRKTNTDSWQLLFLHVAHVGK